MSAFDSYITELKKLHIHDLSLDARQTNTNTAFVAIPGSQMHGVDFISQVLTNNAICIIVDAKDSTALTVNFPSQLSIIKIPDLLKNIGNFAAAFYQNPSTQIKIHAITGTNGKTSCSQFIAQALHAMHTPCGIIGTLGTGIYPSLTTSVNTTPDAINIQRFLRQLLENNIVQACMEASSIALVAGRLQSCQIETAIFTNLTQDHLDYHGTMEAYGDAKRMLFNSANLKYAIINADDAFGLQLLKDFKDQVTCIAYTTKPSPDWDGPCVTTQSSHLNQHGIEAQLQIRPFGSKQDENIIIQSALIGAFNLSNLLAIVAWLVTQNISIESISQLISKLQPVAGRMQRVSKPGKPAIIIDYAHTPDALAQALSALRSHCEGDLWCVFGCGGNRDKTKRPLMGQVAAELADHIIITNDNPRLENPEHIAHEIFTGIPPMCMKVDLELDRYKAIQLAIAEAKPQDIILIAGKGHEDYQDIQGIKYHFSDIEVAKELL